MLVIGCIFVLCLGLVQALAPDMWWHMTESWKSNATEPSDRYLLSTRISGIVFIVVIVACIIGLLFFDQPEPAELNDILITIQNE